MALTNEEIDRLATIGFEAEQSARFRFHGHPKDTSPGFVEIVSAWDIRRAEVRAIADALIPEGHVVVPRARYERLLAVAYAAHYKRHTDAEEGTRMLAIAVGSLESGDLKPLPD